MKDIYLTVLSLLFLQLNAQFEKSAAKRFVTLHGLHSENWVGYENQPATHLAHLFNFTGAPWLTQYSFVIKTKNDPGKNIYIQKDQIEWETDKHIPVQSRGLCQRRGIGNRTWYKTQ
jgi:hypothetical protein